ncbi:MFS transporter, partial [Bacillus paranthracis]|nr:MFS transporter [Bacillus paranthracis]
AGIVLFIMLRPEPLDIANRIAAYKEQNGHDNDSYMVNQKNNKRGLAVGATVIVLTQIVVVAIMTMTPVHMKHHGHGLGEVGIVIGFHIGSMYLPSLVTG